jgi:hypothetical protein
VLLGLSTRANNALDRMNVVTVRDLLQVPLTQINRLRGVGNKTRREIAATFNDLRLRFPDVENIGPAKPEPKEEEQETQVASVDLIAEQLRSAGVTGEAEKRILYAFLGFDDVNQPGSYTWPSQTDTASRLEITRARVSQVIVRARERWKKNPSVTALRDAVDMILQTYGGAMTVGDLYQDLSESARKRYALLQTPDFIEEFILDRTLMPAIGEFGYTKVRMIDPTCGSGHFLLGGFHRLYRLWARNEPGLNSREHAQRALEGVYGVDLNPNVVAIARFRLLVAALKVCEARRLGDAPGFRIHLAVGDSLLHGPRIGSERDRTAYLDGMDPLQHVYETEDAMELRRILGQQYHAVVGNPPYITVRDSALNAEYRKRFGSCHRQYSLAVPFMERLSIWLSTPPDMLG